MAATLSSRVRFAVILVGPTVSVELEIHYSELVEGDDAPLAEAEERLAAFDGPRGFNPLPVLDQVDIPILWLYGLVDRSVPTRACLAVHDSIAADHEFALRFFDRLGHGLGPFDMVQHRSVASTETLPQ